MSASSDEVAGVISSLRSTQNRQMQFCHKLKELPKQQREKESTSLKQDWHDLKHDLNKAFERAQAAVKEFGSHKGNAEQSEDFRETIEKVQIARNEFTTEIEGLLDPSKAETITINEVHESPTSTRGKLEDHL